MFSVDVFVEERENFLNEAAKRRSFTEQLGIGNNYSSCWDMILTLQMRPQWVQSTVYLDVQLSPVSLHPLR